MNRARSRFRWLWLLAILLVVTPSSGDDGPSSVHVARYDINVTPHGDDASFRVLIGYGHAATKADGFKFFGKSDREAARDRRARPRTPLFDDHPGS